MSLDLSQAEQIALEATLKRGTARITAGELKMAAFGAVVPVTAEIALMAARPAAVMHPLTVALCVLALAVAARMRIFLPMGFTMPTQMAFVPLMFAAPPDLLVPLVALAMMLAGAVDVARGRIAPSRLLFIPGNAAYAIGPAAVLTIAGISAAHAPWWLLVAAVAAQFMTDFVLWAARLVVAREGLSLAQQLSDSWVYGVDAALSCVGVVIAEQARHAPLAVAALLPLLVLFGVFTHERQRRVEGMLELGNAYRGTALLLGDVVEADDGYTGEHCKDVVSLALAVGTELQLGPDRMRNLEFGALLHDVGKIAIPKEIINKPGRLDAREWTIVKTHTTEGQSMLDRVGGFMREVGLIVRSHHERWDGGGYPDGLAREAIPLESRIVAVCDTWNAMRTNRAYRQALSYEAAMAELLACSGSQFDPRIVLALVRVVQRTEGPSAPAPIAAAPMAPVDAASAPMTPDGAPAPARRQLV